MSPRNFLLALVLACLAIAALAAPASADDSDRKPAEIRVSSRLDSQVGQPARIVSTLVAADGSPISDAELLFFIDERVISRLKTGHDGRAHFTMPDTLSAGEYAVEVVFRGDRLNAPVRFRTRFLIEPALLTVQVLPPLEGVEFSMGEAVFASGPDGVVRRRVNRPGEYQLVLESGYEDSDSRRIEFAGWSDGSDQPSLPLVIQGDQTLQVGFELFYPVEFQFLDPAGSTVRKDRVASLEISSSNGLYRVIEPGSLVWLEANTIFPRLSGLDSVAVVHSLQEVQIDGSNVVNRGQQRFIVQQAGEVALDLLLHDVTFNARDLLFARPVGQELAVTYPDGTTRVFPVGPNGVVSLNDLARGSYTARLSGDGLATIDLPVVLSRDQSIRVPLLSSADIGLSGGFVLLLVLELLVLGKLRKDRYQEAGGSSYD